MTHSSPQSSTERPLTDSEPSDALGSRAEITHLLRAATSGERRDIDALMAAIYGDLRRLAASHMGAERVSHTLQPTALVHEAYVRLIDQRATGWRDRLHFFAIASRIIRRILIDHARARDAEKRGGGGERMTLSEALAARAEEPSEPARDIDLLDLDRALEELAEIDAQQARVVELRYFGGCSIQEVAELLSVSSRTVDRQWRVAKGWLFERLQPREREEGGGAPRAE